MDAKHTNLFELISELSGSKRPLVVHPAYCKMMGDSLPGGMFLAQCIFWTGKGADPDGWFYRTAADWENECFLSKYDVTRFSKLCVGLGILETKTAKVGRTPKKHYRINPANFLEFAAVFFSGDSPNLESQNLESQNLESQNLESQNLESLRKSKFGKSIDLLNLASPIYTERSTVQTLTEIEEIQSARVDPAVDEIHSIPFVDEPATEPPKVKKPRRSKPLAMDARKLQGGFIPSGQGATATEVYREVFSHTPTSNQMAEMNRRVTDLEKWRADCKGWDLKGYRQNNIADLLNFHEGKPKPGANPIGPRSMNEEGANYGHGNGSATQEEIERYAVELSRRRAGSKRVGTGL